MISEDLHGLFKKTKIALIASMLFATAGLCAYIFAATRAVPTILISGDGKAYGGTPTAFVMGENEFRVLAKDTIEAVLFRTEVGNIDSIKDATLIAKLTAEAKARGAKPPLLRDLPIEQKSHLLNPFVSPEVLEQMAKEVTQETRGNLYRTFAVSEIRIGAANPVQVEMVIRGRITSRSTLNFVSSEAYLAALFRPTMKTAANPLGYRLEGLLSIDADKFYAKERAERVRKATETGKP